MLPANTILSLKKKTPFGMGLHLKEVNRESQRLFPFVKMAENYNDVAKDQNHNIIIGFSLAF